MMLQARFASGPVRHTPKFLVCTIALLGLLCLGLDAIPCDVFAQIPQMDSPVFHFATYRDSLIAVCHPTEWDWYTCSVRQSISHGWRELGSLGRPSGFTWVNDIMAYDDKLLVAGNFASVNGEAIPLLAAWDGGAWSSLGGTVSGGQVWTMTAFEGDLVIGGDFSMIGEVPVENIARWDGTGWSAVGGGRDDPVYEVTVFDGKIMAAVNHAIETLDNGTWVRIGEVTGSTEGGCYIQIETFLAEDKLYVGGTFTRLKNDVKASRVACWDGNSWSKLDGIGCGACYDQGYDCDYGNVYNLARYQGALIASGIFGPNSVARWDGAEWQALKCGTDGLAYDTVEWANGLLVAGNFDYMFCYPYSNIAIWKFDVVPLPSFKASAVFDRVRLEWTAPSSPNVAAVVVRFSTDDFPETPEDGAPVANGNGGVFAATPDETAHFDHVGLSKDTTYYYSAFVQTSAPVKTSGSMKCRATVSGRPFGKPHKLGDQTAKTDGGGSPGPSGESVGIIDLRGAGDVSVVPNPMSSASTTCFDLAKEGRVRVTVYDAMGRVVRSLLDGIQGPGNHAVIWDGRSDTGEVVPAGLYFLKIETPHSHSTAKIMVLR